MNWQRSVPRPALVVHPPASSLDEAHGAIDLWEHYSGKTLDSAQRLAVELMLAEGEDGRWAARSTGRVEARQNGKGDEVEVVETWGLVQRGEWIVHWAHELPTAKAAHRRLVDLLEGHSDLRRLVRQVRYGNSDRSIEMNSGAVIVYRTRTSGGGRGLDDISRLVVDEAQLAQPEQLASATPILAANPNPQTNYVGSAGIAEKSDWWWELRLRALKGGEGQFAWLEHSAENVELSPDGKVLSSPPDVNDRELWYVANPALGLRIEEAFLEDQLENLGPLLFAREHLGVWDPYPGGDGGFLPFDEWQKLGVVDPSGLGSVSYGLAVGPDWAAIGSAARMPDGSLYIDSVDYQPGTDWIVGRLDDLFARKRIPIRVNPLAPEGALIRQLEHRRFEVVEVKPREYEQACGEILDSIKNGTIHHLRQPALDRSVRAAQRRDSGKHGAWVWADPPQTDIMPLKAATLALTGVTDQRRPRIHWLEE